MAPPTKASSPSPKKRKRTSSTTSHVPRPPPPPPPPASLVRLLQTDASVVDYFTSLQANLAADVQVWKDRAKALQVENNELKAAGREPKEREIAERRQTAKKKAHKPSSAEEASKATTPATKQHTESNRSASETKVSDEDKNNSVNDASRTDNGSELPATLQGERNDTVATQLGTGIQTLPLSPLQVGVPIDDSMFDSLDEEDDDDDDDDGLAKDVAVAVDTLDSGPAVSRVSVTDRDAARAHTQQVFAFLKEAYQITQLLGISLVDRTNVSDDNIQDSHVGKAPNEADDSTAQRTCVSDSTRANDDAEPAALAKEHQSVLDDVPLGKDDDPTVPNKEREDEAIYSARSNEQVLRDILDWLRSPNLTNIHAICGEEGQNADEDELICPTSFVLCCNPLPSTKPHESTESMATAQLHPLLQAKRLLIRALVLLDTFCSCTITKAEWDAFFPKSNHNGFSQLDRSTLGDGTVLEESTVREMEVGLRGRKEVVNRLLCYLDSDITERWACHDRSKRQASAALSYVGGDGFGGNVSATPQSLKGGASSKLYVRTMVERSMACQIVSTLHFLRGGGKVAAQTIQQYIVSTTPCLNQEEHPKQPPVLSMMHLESLLLQSDEKLLEYQNVEERDVERTETWFDSHYSSMWNRPADCALFFRALSLPIHVSASIWRKRRFSTDAFIHDSACIELACYRRLMANSPWLRTETTSTAPSEGWTTNDAQLDSIDWLEVACSVANSLLENPLLKEWDQGILHRKGAWHIATQIVLILRGNVHALEEIATEAMSKDRIPDAASLEGNRGLLLCSLLVSTSVVRRALAMRLIAGTDQGATDSVLRFNSNVVQFIETVTSSSVGWSSAERLPVLSAIVECASTAADGKSVLRAIQLLGEMQVSLENVEVHDAIRRPFLDSLARSSQIPVVRVINLERRKDRLNAFIGRAIRERIVVIKAVASLKEEARAMDQGIQTGEGHEFGLDAIDGQGRLVEATDRLVKYVGPTLNKLVETHWRPNDLKPFDVNAPDVETMVRMSPSERACALSHIGSWIGVKRSLQMFAKDQISWVPDHSSSTRFQSTQQTVRLFKISGFAKGPASAVPSLRDPRGRRDYCRSVCRTAGGSSRGAPSRLSLLFSWVWPA